MFQDDDSPYFSATLKTTSGYVFGFSTDSFGEISWPIYCTVIKDGETIFPMEEIRLTSEIVSQLKFALIEGGENNEVVAIVEKSTPQVVFAICDLRRQKSGFYSSVRPADLEVMQELLSRLNKTNVGKPLVLPDSVDDEVRVRLKIIQF